MMLVGILFFVFFFALSYVLFPPRRRAKQPMTKEAMAEQRYLKLVLVIVLGVILFFKYTSA